MSKSERWRARVATVRKELFAKSKWKNTDSRLGKVSRVAYVQRGDNFWDREID